MNARGARLRILAGSVVLIGTLLTAVAVVARPAVTRPAARVARVLWSALDAEREDDLVARVPDLRGIRPGLPAFRDDDAGTTRPVAHVVRCGRDADGAWVRLRFEPGVDPIGPWKLRAYPPSRKLRAALETAVTREAAARFGAQVAARVRALWSEALLPEAKRRLPDFLARIDPTRDTEARRLVTVLAGALRTHLDPLLDGLLAHIAAAVKHKFDLLDRLGMLWKVVRGDAHGLERELAPVAKDAARTWWAQHQGDVLQAVGHALDEHAAEVQAWVGGELLDAAREELAGPVFEAQRPRIEAEAQRLLRSAADAFVNAPGGGFRVRFAAVLRTNLLDKRTALLLLTHGPAAR
jgi:uncharacterized protein (DUF2267 family)